MLLVKRVMFASVVGVTGAPLATSAGLAGGAEEWLGTTVLQPTPKSTRAARRDRRAFGKVMLALIVPRRIGRGEKLRSRLTSAQLGGPGAFVSSPFCFAV